MRRCFSPSTSSLVLRVAAATWGFAVAVALLPHWIRPARPGQPPGFATSINLDANAPVYFIAALILLPIVASFLLRPILRRFDDAQPWAQIAAAMWMFAALWLALIDQNVTWTIVPTALALVACFALRRFDAQFTRRDVILLPTTLTVFLALIDVAPFLSIEKQFLVAAMLVCASRAAVSAAVSAASRRRPAQIGRAHV